MMVNGTKKELQELSIEKACEEYNNSVKLTLEQTSKQLDDSLSKCCNGLEELSVKIAARTNFLEKSPTFLSCLVYDKNCIKCENLTEFDNIKVTLTEHCKRIQEKVDEIQKYHKRLLELVVENGISEKKEEEEEEEHFHDCDTEPKKIPPKKKKRKEPDFSDLLEEKNPENKETELKDILKVPERSASVIHINTNCSTGSLSPKNSFDKVTIQKNAYSDLNLTLERPPVQFQIFPDILPDVSRRKPQEDLHGKLVQQLVATDSLEGFLKLMGRKPTKKKNNKNKKSDDLGEKYTGSLYFFPKEQQKVKSATSKKKEEAKKSTYSISSNSTCCNLLVTSSQLVSNQDKSRKTRHSLARNKLKYYDLLDDLDHNDLKPIQSEYPRRDNVHPFRLDESKSYLHRIMEENDRVWKKLLQPVEEKEKRKKKKPKEKKKIEQKPVNNLIEYLTAPEQKYLSHIPQSLVVMPVKIIYDNFPTKEEGEEKIGNIQGDVPKKIEGKLINTVSFIQGDTLKPEEKKIDDKMVLTQGDNKIQYSIQSDKPSQPPHTKKEILNQLKGLKMKNDNIQKNIQKAIDVIEMKMIDLLSSPTDATSTDAFNAMEKEITSVLKMMNENDSEKMIGKMKIDKIEPEKDETIISPRVKKGGTMLKAPVTLLERGDTNELKRERSKSPEVKSEDKQKKNEEKRKLSKERNSKRDKVKVIKSPKTEETVKSKIEDNKKAANIEEGERLLGQVDDVIKKIDRIYSRFYDDSKGKPKVQTNFQNISDFFDGLKQADQQPMVVEYKSCEYIPEVYQEVKSYHQSVMYYSRRMEFPETKAKLIEAEFVPKEEFIMEEVIPKEEFIMEEVISKEEFIMEELRPKEEFVPKEEFIAEYSDSELEVVPKVGVAIKRASLDCYDRNRHDHTLKVFYTLFFSSIFVALNFDYAS